MNLLKNIPGPFLVFLGAVSLSFGGLLVKSFEGSTLSVSYTHLTLPTKLEV